MSNVLIVMCRRCGAAALAAGVSPRTLMASADGFVTAVSQSLRAERTATPAK